VSLTKADIIAAIKVAAESVGLSDRGVLESLGDPAVGGGSVSWPDGSRRLRGKDWKTPGWLDTVLAGIASSVNAALSGFSYSSTAQSVVAANAGGISAEVSRGDHSHQGVHSMAKSGSAALYGDVTLSQGSGVTLTQAGQDIQIASSMPTLTTFRNTDPYSGLPGGTVSSNKIWGASFVVPGEITVSSVAILYNSGAGAGRYVDFGLYTMAGVRLFSVGPQLTTGWVQGLKSFTLAAPIAVSAGEYWWCWTGNSGLINVAGRSNGWSVSLYWGESSTSTVNGTLPANVTLTGMTYYGLLLVPYMELRS
jgi:hypothetical protein